MASEAEALLQAVRSWAKAWATTSALTNAQVIASDQEGGRPALPYLSVFVSVSGIPIGHDETVYGLTAGNPRYRVQGERTGSVQIHGYGSGSLEWLETLTLAVHDPGAVAGLHAAGVVLGRPTAIRSVPRMMNANREPHYVMECPITYRSVGPTWTVPATVFPPVPPAVVAPENELVELSSTEPDSLPLDFDVTV